MPTNKIVLRTKEEFMSDFEPTYQPLYSIFLDGKTQKYDAKVGKHDFKRLDAVGDLRAKHITPKDSVLRQVASREGSKSFKNYFFANQYIESELQDRQGVEDVIAQVLDEHNKQADDLLLLGEGTSNSTMINNGLFWSSDANYRLESSVEVAKDADGFHLIDLHSKIINFASIMNQVQGRKLIIPYGTTAMPKFNSLYAASTQPFRRILKESLGDQYTLVDMPSAVTPSGANGFIMVNMDQVKLHYSQLPTVFAQGMNDEMMYAWWNFLMGSMMLEVLVDDGIIRQPVTFAA